MNPIHLSQEKAPQSTTYTLSIIQNIKLINKLINIVATFCYDTKICHKTKVITLLKTQTIH